jgi:ornithine cyclodeaminase/alanine dehydrogenase-like protein (mu-crystallin family)
MPGFLPGSNTLGIKIVTLFPDNPKQNNLPFIHALIVLMDSKTGRPLAVLDGEKLTAIRTGAASGLATDLLARKDAGILTIIGAGVQAAAQLEAVATVRRLDNVFIVDRDQDKAEIWAENAGNHFPFSVSAAAVEEALPVSDIICTVTTSAVPVFPADLIRRGTHINALGAYKPDRREIPAETVAQALVVLDERRACMAEAGDLVMAIRENIISEDHPAAELGDVLTGNHPGRTAPDQITLFKSVGNAAQDLTASAKIMENLKKHHHGF